MAGNGSEERDRTPPSQVKGSKVGKFWVYEQAIRIPYYAIYEVQKEQVEVYHLQDNVYQMIAANDRGHYAIPPMGVELGIWQGMYQNMEAPWLRWWDAEGNLLLEGDERAEQERQRAEQERQRAEQERQARLDAIPRLLEMGLEIEQIADALGLAIAEVQVFNHSSLEP
jgi:Putative restriction endonuclease